MDITAAVDQLAQAISQLTQRSDWPDNLVQIRGSALLHIRDSKLVPQTVEGVGNAWERIESQLQGRRVTPEEAKAIIQQVLGDQSGQPTAQAADSRPVYTSTVRNGKIGATVQLDGDIVTVEWDDKGEGATRIDANDWPQDTGRPQDHQAIYLTKEEIVKRGLGVNIRLHYSNVIHMIDEALKRAKWEAHPAGENRPLTELDKEFERLRGLADGPIQRGNAREIEQLKDSLTKVYDQMPEGRRKESYNERLYDLWKALIDLGDKRREQERLAREAEAGPASGPIYTASRTDLGIKVEVQGDIVRIKPIGTSPIWRQKAAPEPIQFRLSEYPKSTEGRLSFLDSLGSRDFTSATDGVRLLISKATEKQQKEEAKRPRQAEPNEQAQPGRQTPEAIEPGVYFLLETDEAFRVFGTGERPGTWRLAKVNGGTESSYPRDWFTMNAYTIKPGQTYWDKSTGRPIKVTQVDEYGFIRIRPEDENERQVSAKWLAENATSKPPVEKEGLSPDLRALAMHIATETRGNSFLWYSERDREGLVQEVRRAASATGTPVPPEKRQIFEELVQSRIEGKKVDISEATEVIQAAVKAVQLPGVDELTPVTWRIQDRINAERDFWTNTDSQNSLLVDIMDYMSRAGAFKGADNIDVEEATAQRVMDLLRDTKPNLADARKAVSLALSQARSSTMESGGATDARTETDLREPLHDNAGRVSYEDREALEGELSESVQGIQDTSGTTGTRPASSGEYVPVRGDSGATRDESDAGGTRGGDGRSVQGTQKPDRRPVEPSEPPREPTTQTPPNPQAVLHDYRITDDDALGSGGPKTKFRDNLRAMQIIKQLREEGRKATPEEQAALVRWVGWGNSAFNKVFGEYGSYQGNAWDRQEAERNNWETEYDQLREVMDDKEFRSAAHSRLNAHYTSPEIIRGMWEAVKNMGLGKLHTIRVLEPGAGIGHFLGLMPDDLAGKAQRTAVEMDRFSGEILSNLYQNADVRIQNFQDFLYPKDSFDLVISNVPFSQEDKMVIDEWVNDGSRKWLNRESLHNQYFVRSIELLRPGGVMAAITTHFTMDAPASKPIREYIAKQADLLGAIRLPKTAFGQIAGTEVVTDILFLRKRLPGEEPNGIAWGKTVTYKNPEGPERAAINEYFHAHPEMVLGDHSFTGSMYAKNEYTVLSRGYDLGRQLQEAIGNLPKDILDNGTRDPADGILAHEWKIEESGRPPMPGSFIIRRDNTIGQWMGNVVKEVQFKGPRDEDKVRRIVQMRQSMWETNRQGTENLMEWAKSRDVLRAQFREFIRTYGLLTDDELKKLTRRDTNAAVVRALQKDDPKLIEEAQRGALVRTETIGSGRNKKQVPIYDWSRVPDELLEKLETAYFREPQMAVRKRVEHVDTAKDAMLVSMDELGRIDMNRMTELSGKTPDEIMEELGPVVYQDPGGHILLAEDYLSGNVRQKLREAEVAATRDPSFQRNVEALKAVQPEDIPPVDIAVRLGAPWIPPEIVKDFAAHLVGAEWAWNARKISVAFNRLNGDWRIRDLRNNFRTRDAYTKWSIDKKWDLEALLNKALIGGEIKIYESAGPEGKKVLDKEATALAIQKVAALHDEFRKWLWADEDRADFLGRIYNERYNAEVPRQYDGSHLTFPGMNPHIKFMGHQKNGVWRYLQSGTILLAHEVGAGKTFECIAIAMEARRLGKARKPVIIVPKNTVGQWEKAFRLLYPESNILVPNEDDFAQENRKEYVSRVMTGDWDAVILTHPQFFRIPVHYQTEIDYLDEYVEQLTILVNQEKEAQRARSQTPEGARSQKAMEKALSAAKARIALLQAEARKLKDDAVFWEDVGCDLLMVDEADEFKNLEFPTRMGQIKGVTNTGSKMATDLYMKSRGILRRNNGAGLVFGTGTPISNAVGELWTMLRYLAPGMLEKNDMHMFDMWAKVFANPSQVTEQTTTGDWATVTRLVKYDNLPELSKLWQSVADIVFSEDVPQLEKRKPRVRGGGRIAVECEASAWQKDFRKTLKYRAEHMDPNDKKSDNFLNLMTDARMAAVDPRLIDATQDLPANGKVAKLAENVSRIYNDEAEFQGTQLIFMDFGTPKSGKGADQRRATALTRARRSQETMIDALQDWRMKEILDEMKMAREMAEEAGEPFDEKPYRDRLNQLAMEPRPTLKPILDSDLKLQKSLYEEIKERLVAAGVKEEEIAFIHEAAADEEKEILFEQVRRGETRILFGSTGKMGAGTNVQDRLVAIHHLDTPWKPRDIEQREGRILRQGNLIYGPKLDDEDNVLDPGRGVEIYQYLTKDSLDTLMWQRVEYKWKMIKSIMKKNVTMRSAEEVDGDVADANMFIAITMDNPLVVERLNREAEVAQLEAEYAGWRDQQRYLQVQRAQLPGRIEGYETGIAQLAKFTVLLPKVPKKAVLTIDGEKTEGFDCNERLNKWVKANLEALRKAAKRAGETYYHRYFAKTKVGTYGPYDLYAFLRQERNSQTKKVEDERIGFAIWIPGEEPPEWNFPYEYRTNDERSEGLTGGLAQWQVRIQNTIDHLAETETSWRRELDQLRKEMAAIQAEGEQRYPKEAKLKRLKVELHRIRQKIFKNQKDMPDFSDLDALDEEALGREQIKAELEPDIAPEEVDEPEPVQVDEEIANDEADTAYDEELDLEPDVETGHDEGPAPVPELDLNIRTPQPEPEEMQVYPEEQVQPQEEVQSESEPQMQLEPEEYGSGAARNSSVDAEVTAEGDTLYFRVGEHTFELLTDFWPNQADAQGRLVRQYLKDEDYEVSGILANLANKALERQVAAKPEPLPTEPQMQLEPEMETQPEPEPQAVEIPEGAEKGPWRKWPQVQQIKDAFRTGNPWNPTYKGTYDKDKWKLLDTGVTIAHRKSGGYNVEFGQYHSIGEAKTLGQAKSLVMNEFIRAWAGLADERAIEYYRQFARQKDLPEPMTWAQMMAEGAMDKKAKAPRPIEEPEPERDPNKIYPEDYPTPALLADEPDLRPPKVWKWDESWLNVDRENPANRATWEAAISKLEQWATLGRDDAYRHLTSADLLFAFHQADVYRDALNRHTMASIQPVIYDREALLLDNPRWSDRTKPLTPHDYEVAYRRGLRHREAGDAYDLPDGLKVPNRYGVPHVSQVERAVGHPISFEDFDFWVDAWDLGNQGKPMNRFWEKPGQPEMQPETTRTGEPAPVQPQPETQPTEAAPAQPREELPRAEDMPGVPIYESARTGEGARQVAQVQGDIIRVGSIDREGTYILPISFRVSDWPDSRDAQIKLLQGQGVVKQTIETARGWISLVNKALAKQQAAGVAAQPTEAQSEGIRPEEPAPVQAKPEEVALQPVAEPEAQPEMESQRPDMESKPAKTPPVQQGTDLLRTVDEQLNEIANLMAQPEMNLDDMDRRFNEALDILTKAPESDLQQRLEQRFTELRKQYLTQYFGEGEGSPVEHLRGEAETPPETAVPQEPVAEAAPQQEAEAQGKPYEETRKHIGFLMFYDPFWEKRELEDGKWEIAHTKLDITYRGDLDRNSQAIVNGTLTVNGHNLGVYPTDHNAAWTVAGKLQDALDGHAEPWVIELLRQISPKAAERYAAPQEPVADMQPERPVEPQPQREEPTPPEPEPAPVEEEVPPTTQEPNAPKNPWEMTREEYAQWTIAYLQEQNAEGREAIATGRAPDYYEDVIRQHEQDIQRLQAGNWPPEIEDWRRSHIRDAVAQGEPVPPEILAEYPDLAQPTEPEPAPVQAETGELPSVNELPREQQQLLQQAWKAYEEADEYLGQNDPRGIAALDRAQTLLDQAVSSKGKVNLQRYLDELRSQQQYPNEAPGAPTMEQVPPADSRTTAEPAPRLQAVPDEEIPLGEATAPEVAPQPEPAREGKARNSTLEAEAEVKDGVISLMRLGKAAVDIPVGQWPDDFDGQLQFIQERLGEDDGHLRAYRSLISKALEKAGLGPAPITFSMAESDGKVWVQFSKRPEESIRKKMGIMGFRWSKTASRWEAQPRTEADRAALVQSVQKLLGKYSQTEPAPEAQIPSPAGTGTQLPTGQRPTEEQPEPGGQPPIGGQPPAGGPPPDGRPPEGVNIGNPYTPGNDLAKGRGALTRPQSTLQQKLEQALDRVVRAMYDRVYPLKELEKITGIKAYTLARLVPGATMAGESVLEKEVRPIFANLGKEDVDNVQLLMTLERGLDLRTKRPDAKLPGGVEDPQRAIQELQQELGADWQVIREVKSRNSCKKDGMSQAALLA